jgi:hypothetical protein
MLSNLGSDFQTEIYLLQYMFWLVLVSQIDNNLSQPIIFLKCEFSSIRNISCNHSRLPFWYFRMIAAVPLYTILKVIGKIFPENKVIQLLTKIFNLDLTILNSEIQNL